MLSPLLFSLFTHGCVPLHGCNTIMKFGDDTMVVGKIRGNEESAYRDEGQHLVTWCTNHNLVLNMQKAKEFIVDFRQIRSHAYTPIFTDRVIIEHVSSFKYLGMHITNDLTWSLNFSILVKKKGYKSIFNFCGTLKLTSFPGY